MHFVFPFEKVNSKIEVTTWQSLKEFPREVGISIYLKNIHCISVPELPSNKPSTKKTCPNFGSIYWNKSRA